MNEQALLSLASAAGIATHWTDAFGHTRQVEADGLRAVLKALGLAAQTPKQCESALAALAHEQRTPRLALLYTAWAGEAVSLPGCTLPEGTRYEIHLEDEGLRAGQLSRARDGTLQLDALEPGYHRLEAGGQLSTLAVAPRHCFAVADALRCARRPVSGLPWGLSAQLYSLRRHHDGGLGDFTALESLARGAAAQGASALAISPVHAMFSAQPERFSPYAPSSRLFLNALHIDPVRVLGEQAMNQALREMPDTHALERLDDGALVDWPAAARLRLTLLRKLFEQFLSGGTDQAAFSAFCRQGGRALQDHARYEALDAWLRRADCAAQPLPVSPTSDWRQWPEPYRDPQNPSVARFALAHPREVAFHQFLQWQAATGRAAAQATALQAGMAIGLVTDLAVGADPGGSQAWGLQSAMLQGLTVGAPPDLLATQGQDWGLGALSPHALRAQGFAPWLAMLRANMQHSGGVRIDHVLGLMRLWLVPEGAPASAGAYLRYPLQDLLRLTALESARHGTLVIGEDLGTVPEGFSQTLADVGILGIRVLWFQRDGERFIEPASWPSRAIATTSTHDLATVAGWWSGRDIAWRDGLGLLPPGDTAAQQLAQRETDKTALWSAMREDGMVTGAVLPSSPPLDEALVFAGRTPAALVLAPLEDVLGITDQPNLPGTVAGHPNWQQRLPAETRALLERPDVRHRLAALQRARQQASAPPPVAGQSPRQDST